MSDTIIIALIVIIIIAVIVVWYVSSNIREKSNNTDLALNTDEDKILTQWFEENKRSSYDCDISNEQIISKLLKRIYDFDVDPDSIIIGSNLEEKYYNITRKQLNTKFSDKQDCILYLRSVIGLNYEICIINSSKKLLNKLTSNESDLNLFFLNDIIESKLEKTAYDHIRKVLNIRWGEILKTNNDNIIQKENDDSFLYLKKNHNIPNLITHEMTNNERVNLLCSSIEFEALIHRLNSKAVSAI